MALSGSFTQYPISGKEFGLYCTWHGNQNQSGNYTDITLNIYARCYSLDISAKNGSINIDGVQEGFNTPKITDYKNNWHNIWLASKTIPVWHNADGTKSNVSLFIFINKPIVSGSCPWNYANWVNAFPKPPNSDESDYSKCAWLYYQTNNNGNGTERSVYIHAIGKWK